MTAKTLVAVLLMVFVAAALAPSVAGAGSGADAWHTDARRPCALDTYGESNADLWHSDLRRPHAHQAGSGSDSDPWNDDVRRPDSFVDTGSSDADQWRSDERRPDGWSVGGSATAEDWHVDGRRPDDRSYTDLGRYPDRRDAVAVNSGLPFGWKVDPRRPRAGYAEPEMADAAPVAKPGDADGDGVTDDLDRCPDTPRGAWVDRDGCPRDSDGDGVLDGLDRCRNTPKGVRVDDRGCPEATSKMEEELLDTGKLRLQDVYFDTNKATIKAESYGILNEVGEILSKWPQLKVEVGGHTDSRGSEAYNHDLSQRRAQAVRKYLVDRFASISGEQMSARGYGELKPIVGNDTEEGRRLNRRVVFTVLNREVLRR